MTKPKSKSKKKLREWWVVYLKPLSLFCVHKTKREAEVFNSFHNEIIKVREVKR